MVPLNAVETRVLGCLIEKEINTPEYYPLTLNATVNACNQKSSREPLMELTEADVRSALFDLEGLGLVKTRPDSRATKYEHRVRDVLNLRRDETALLCLLMLRGPQTAGELRTRAERMFAFDDLAAVTSALDRLAQREDHLTRLLPRQPGAREARWTHLLSSADAEGQAPTALGQTTFADPAPATAPSLAHPGNATDLEARIRALEARVAALEALPHNTPD